MQQQFNFHGANRHNNNNNKDAKISKSKSKGKQFTSGDRVIPQGLTTQQCDLYKSIEPNTSSPYQKLLYSQLKDRQSTEYVLNSAEKLLKYHNATDVSYFDSEQFQSQKNTLYQLPTINQQCQQNQSQFRIKQITKRLLLTLDAPGIEDDFFTQPIDWSCLDYIILASKNQLYSYHYERKQVVHLTGGNNSTDIPFTSVKWNRSLPQLLASGNRQGQLELWDVGNIKKIKCLKVAQKNRSVNSIGVADNIVACGSSNSIISIYDSRTNLGVTQLLGHNDSVLGLKFQSESFMYGPYLASSSADSSIIIWDLRNQNQVLHKMQGHTGVVKAFDWSSRKNNILVSGGGESDNRLIFWDTNTGTQIQSTQTKSQITSLVFGTLENQEMYTGHGFSDNTIKIWNVENPTKCELDSEIHEHKSRVLAMSISPNGDKLCALDGDEIMKFWDLQNEQKNVKPKTQRSKSKTSLSIGTFR